MADITFVVKMTEDKSEKPPLDKQLKAADQPSSVERDEPTAQSVAEAAAPPAKDASSPNPEGPNPMDKTLTYSSGRHLTEDELGIRNCEDVFPEDSLLRSRNTLDETDFMAQHSIQDTSVPWRPDGRVAIQRLPGMDGGSLAFYALSEADFRSPAYYVKAKLPGRNPSLSPAAEYTAEISLVVQQDIRISVSLKSVSCEGDWKQRSGAGEVGRKTSAAAGCFNPQNH